MTYKSQLEKSKKKLYQKAIAAKILDLMDKLRMENNDNASKRWAYELLQNACDTAFTDQGIDIDITCDENYLSFAHNGMPFTAETLLFLAEQISSKDRSSGKTTGRFGSGFLTTHLLSELVEVSGFIKEPGHPYKQFELMLDRTGRTIEKISESINHTLGMLKDLDKKPNADFNPLEFNTKFRYQLLSKGIKVARAGLRDLQQSIPYLLMFNPIISSIKVNDTEYRLSVVTTEGDTSFATIVRSKGTARKSYFAFLSGGDCTIAVPLAENKMILELPVKLSRIFCCFPLIGSADMSLPIVINSSLFNPNEQRSGFYLTDAEEPQVLENKALFLEAVGLLQQFIIKAYNWSDAHHLCKISNSNKEWLSSEWFEDHVLQPLHNTLLSVQIVETSKGKKLIEECLFPWHEKKEIRNKLWELCNDVTDFTLPLKKHLHDWYTINWLSDNRITLQALANWIHGKASLRGLAKALNSHTDTKTWLNQALVLLTTDERLVNQISQDSLCILPNQSGDFCYACDLYFDKTSSPELKDICNELGYNFHEVLLDKKINVSLVLKPITDQDIAIEIYRLAEQKLAVIERDQETTHAFRKLYLWFNHNKSLAEELFPRLYPKRHRLIADDEIALNLEKARILDDYFNGLPSDEIRNILSSRIKNIAADYDLLIDESSEKTRTSINEEAKQLVIDLLLDQGYKVPELINTDYTFLNGITKPDGTPVLIIVKSALSGKLYLSHREWLALMKADTELYALYKAGSVKRVTLESLLSSGDTFHVRIESKGLNRKSFHDSFQNIPCKFIFQSPASTSEYFRDYEFNTRKS